MPNVSIHEKTDYGFYGYSTINHDYNLKAIKGDKVVVDNATGLMWHQGGSRKYMKWKKAKKWIEKLNKRGYAGYQDWRLPTLEEAASLLQFDENDSDLYIDPIFSKKQQWLWTGDSEAGSEAAWHVYFGSGIVRWRDHILNRYGVRPVRSMK